MPILHSIRGRMLLLSLLAGFVAPAHSYCDDFLALLHVKPTHLEFLGCKQQTDLQGEPWEASYRVAGSHAAQIESTLTKGLGIKKLRRTCCVWESVHNSYRDKQSQLFVILISTDETTIDRRSRWGEIPYFDIKVDSYPEEP